MKKTVLIKSKLYKTLRGAENWNIERANNEGTIMTFNGFFWVECYEVPSKRIYTEPCLGCFKEGMKLRKIGGEPMFCESCFRMYRKEGKKLEEVREITGYWKRLEDKHGKQ